MDYLQTKNFSNNEPILFQFKTPSELYVVTRMEGKYKLFIIDDSNPKGKKLAESRSGGDVMKRIPQ